MSDQGPVTSDLATKRCVPCEGGAKPMAPTVAEAEGHHPDFCVSWNRVKLELFTPAIGGLSENDFIMAAKINELEEARNRSEKREAGDACCADRRVSTQPRATTIREGAGDGLRTE